MTAIGFTTGDTRAGKVAEGAIRWVVAIAGAIVVFGAVIWAKGVSPLAAYQEMFSAIFASGSMVDILIKSTPIILAALAVAVPARAGLTNVGGEGQLVLGGVAAAGVVRWLGEGTPSFVTLTVMLVAAAIAGALWAGIAGVLREGLGINEAVTTLLLNYLAIDLMLFLIYDSWKDPLGSGQPASPKLPVSARLPLVGSTELHMGFIIAVVATGVVWAVLKYTTWGFRLRVVGGNPEAARRAGYRVGALMLGAMLVGGALAGIGGFTQLAGAEFKLRPGFLLQYGYIGFLASWLARHHPVRVALAAIVLAALTIAGDSLQIDSGLPAASVNILMALVLLAVFGWTGKKKGSGGMNLLLEILSGGVRGGTSILYAALGETISERAGVVNLGTEGCMLAGACAGYAVAAQTGNPWAGAAAGALAGALLALVLAFFTLTRGSNQLATGLVVLFLALGLTSLFGAAYVSQTITPFRIVAIPGLSDIPWIGPVFFEQDPLTYLAYLLVPATWWLLFRSRWGLLIRGAGERTEVLATYGHRVIPTQYLAVLIGGALSGIGGAQLSTAYANAWFENMIQGRGFIAVAVVIFANRRPVPVAAGSLLFGTALALSPALQSRGYSVNQFALHAIPYVATIVALVVLARRQNDDTPEGLKKVFELSPTR